MKLFAVKKPKAAHHRTQNNENNHDPQAKYHRQLHCLKSVFRTPVGLRLLDREPDRSLFYRVGSGVLLLFLPSATRPGGTLPAHGASGPIHVCFRVPPEDYDAWKERIGARGLALLREVDWPRGRSFYFHDPDRNLLEIADGDIWPE